MSTGDRGTAKARMLVDSENAFSAVSLANLRSNGATTFKTISTKLSLTDAYRLSIILLLYLGLKAKSAKPILNLTFAECELSQSTL